MNHGKRNFLIIGNPGIGKSFFLVYLFFVLLRAFRLSPSSDLTHIVLRHAAFDKDMYYVFDLYNMQYYRVKHFESLRNTVLAQDSTWFLVDGLSPDECLARTILVSPPRETVWGKWATQARISPLRHMPIWDLDELDLCRRTCFPGLAAVDMNAAVEKWGPVPRWALNDPRGNAQNWFVCMSGRSGTSPPGPSLIICMRYVHDTLLLILPSCPFPGRRMRRSGMVIPVSKLSEFRPGPAHCIRIKQHLYSLPSHRLPDPGHRERRSAWDNICSIFCHACGKSWLYVLSFSVAES